MGVRTLDRSASQAAEVSNSALHAALGNNRANTVSDLIKGCVQQGFMYEQREIDMAHKEALGVMKLGHLRSLRTDPAKECREKFTQWCAMEFDASVIVIASSAYTAKIKHRDEEKISVEVKGTTTVVPQTVGHRNRRRMPSNIDS